MSPQRWMTGFTILGVAARLVRYVLHFPLWEDEAFLNVSLAHRSYGGLLQPLDFHQVAPVPFLWLQKAVTDALGFNEWSLRLVACVAGIAALFLFRRIAERLLDGWARVAAYGYFAVAYPGIRYAAEAKPYGIDLLMSVLILWCIVEWLATRRRRWLWGLAAVSPLAIAMSLPASMVVITASVVAGRALWEPAVVGRDQPASSRHDWLAWVSMNAAALASGLVALALLRASTESQLAWARGVWIADFLPVDEFWRVPAWLVSHLAGDYLAIPFGGDNFGSTGTLILVGVGVYVCQRRQQRDILWLALLPVAINLALSALRLYPFGGAVKFAMYEMPMICIAAGAGVSALVLSAEWLGSHRRQIQVFLLCSIAAVAVVSMARDVIRPYKTMSDQRARQWAREFWGAPRPASERVDLKTDLGLDFSPLTFTELSWSALYLVNQQIYSPRLRGGRPPNWDRVSRERPLTVAEYVDASKPYDFAARERWLTSMAARYALAGTEEVPMHRYDKSERTLLAMDVVRLYTFVPRPAAETAR